MPDDVAPTSGLDEAGIAQARAQYEAEKGTHEALADALRVLVSQLCKNAELHVDQVTSRAKETASVVDKIRRRRYDTLDKVVDKVGVRVITRYQSSVPHVVALLKREFEVVEITEHGAETPEAFGYASSHLIVKLGPHRKSLLEWQEFSSFVAEVQVRSILQHAWAAISHSLAYKTESEVPALVRRRLYRVAALLETGDEIFDTYRQEVEDLRTRYEKVARGEDWRDLPLDLESMEAAFSRFPWREIAALAVANGWDSPEDPEDYESISDPAARRSVSDLIRLAAHVGYRSLRDIAAITDNIENYESTLRHIAEKGLELEGDVPHHGGGIDALAILIIAEFPDLFARRSSEIDLTFSRWIWRIILARAEGRDAIKTAESPA